MVARALPLLPLAPVPSPVEPAPLGDRIEPGRLVELCEAADGARTTAAVSLVIRAQRDGEPAAWVQSQGGELYPPDLAASGARLDELVVVQVPRKAGPFGLARATELLLRSGAFALVVVDLTGGAPRGDAWQGRLGALARQHESTVVLLTATREEEGSAGPMVALRVGARRVRTGPGRFVLEHRILKDKTGAAGSPRPEPRSGPAGLP